jgi:hypothetical protein
MSARKTACRVPDAAEALNGGAHGKSGNFPAQQNP